MAAALAFTLAEAATILDPPLSEAQLRAIIRALRWQPGGHRRNGRPGHPAATYDAARLMRLHGALVPFMETHVTGGNSGDSMGLRPHARKQGTGHGQDVPAPLHG